MNKCIECENEFEPYLAVVGCSACGGEGYIESDMDEFMRDDYRICWQCKGKGEITVTENAFCDEFCREEHFEFDND